MGIGQFQAPQAFGYMIEAPPELAATGAKLCLGGLLYPSAPGPRERGHLYPAGSGRGHPAGEMCIRDSLKTGLFVGKNEQIFYQRRADGELYAPAGKYLCQYELSAAPVSQWLTDTIAAMKCYAAEQDLRLEECFYAEFNDIILAYNGAQQLFPRMIRGRLL